MNKELTFNDLPMVVAQLRDEVVGMKQMITNLQSQNKPQKANTHIPMSVEEASAYLKMPMATLYMKLGNGSIPATKPGKRYCLYQDELDKWLGLTARILYLSRRRKRTQPFLLETSASRNP